MSTTITGFRRSAASVFETDADPAMVDRAQLTNLVAAARVQDNRRARLLLHSGRDDSLHEMIIALPFESCDRPHINFRSGKSFCALSGQFAVICFSDDGQSATPVILSSTGQAGALIVRLRRPIWHTIIPLQGDTVFMETISGPFTGNQFAPWFPEPGTDAHAAEVDRLRTLCRAAAGRMAWPDPAAPDIA